MLVSTTHYLVAMGELLNLPQASVFSPVRDKIMMVVIITI